MIFKELRLENFKSHINSIIKFEKGTTIILGENGAGKSSIFEGINFALYKKYNVKSLNDLINTNAKKMTVTLHFLVGQQEYKVVRTRQGNKSTAQLYNIDKENKSHLIVEGDKEVNKTIEDILEMDADLFLNAIYIKQGEIDNLITQKSSERKQNISKLLRLEELEVSYKNIASVISNYELKKVQVDNLIENDFQDNKEELQEQQKELINALQNQQRELDTLQKQIQDIKEKINEQNTKSLRYQKLNSDKTYLLTRTNDLLDQISDLNQQLEDLEEHKKIVDDYTNTNLEYDIELCKEIINTYDEIDELYTSYANISDELKIYMKQFYPINDIGQIYNINRIVFDDGFIADNAQQLNKIIKKDVEETTKTLNNVTQNIQDISISISVLERAISDDKESLQALDDVDSICPICQSIIDDEHKKRLINNYQSLIIENSDKLDKRIQEKESLLKEQKELKDMLNDKNNYLSQIINLMSSDNYIATKQDKFKLIEANILQADNKIIFLKNKIHNDNLEVVEDAKALYDVLLHKQEEYQEANVILQNKSDLEARQEKLVNEYTDKISELDKVGKKINDLNYNSELLQSYQDEQANLQEKYYPLVKDIGQIENDMKYNQSKIDNIDNKIKQNKENKIKSKQLAEFISFLKDIRELYSKDGLQKDIRLLFRPKIEGYTQDFFSKFDFDYSTLRLSDDYDVVLIGPSGETNISMISGGEKIAIALALRLGIAQAITINNIETILLDEPTIHLDSLRKQEFVKVIQDISLVPQTIIITHDADLENAATNVITVEKYQGESVII